jgi:hypothetical protein
MSDRYAYGVLQGHASEHTRKAAEGYHPHLRHRINHRTQVSHTASKIEAKKKAHMGLAPKGLMKDSAYLKKIFKIVGGESLHR